MMLSRFFMRLSGTGVPAGGKDSAALRRTPAGTPVPLIIHAVLAILTAPPAQAADAPDSRRSGYAFMGPPIRAMQDDDMVNPASLWLLDGETLWHQPEGSANRSCADCHGDVAISMRGVAARYPSFDTQSRRPIDLEQRINLCRTAQQQASPLAFESHDLLALTAYVARQSRGMPIAIDDSAALHPFLEMGEKLYYERQGQLNLSCAQCHEDNAGRSLGGSTIPEGHPTGYPLYRLEWQSLGSLQRRLRNCMTGMRAAPYAYGAGAFVDLELYLMWRANGMPVETPAVRP
jgi:sulfur-oxidizing protein SoxA